MPEVTITEIEDLEADRVDLVKSPANGFPILLMKAVNAQGGVDEKPDIALAEHVVIDLFKLIASEAQEGAVGNFREIRDIQMLTEALCCIRCFLDMERMHDEDDGESIAKDLPGKADLEKAAGYLIKRKFSAERRRELAAEGKALPDGSYPIEDAEDLGNAATLARSGHGDVAAAKRLIAKRAKELGVANPLASDSASKGKDQRDPREVEQVLANQDRVDEEINPVGPVRDGKAAKGEETSAPEGAAEKGTLDVEALTKKFEDAVAEVRKSSEERIQALEADLAKVRATPIPGGPVITAPPAAHTERNRSDQLAKALHYEHLADLATEPDLKREYSERAKAAKAAAAPSL